MRVNRAKAVRKHLQFFKIVYGYDKTVYHIVLDGNFIFAAIKFKIDIKERLGKLLQGSDCKIYVLKSVIEELITVGAKAKQALDFAKTYCESIDDSQFRGENANDKTISMMKKQHEEWLAAPTQRKRKYMVATQDKDLRSILGHVPGIPLIYLNKVTLVLEPPSAISKDFNEQIEAGKVALKPAEAQIVEGLKKRKRVATTIIDGAIVEAVGDDASESDDEEAVEEKPAERKKHKAFAANPLASLAPSKDSLRQQKLKKNKYKR